MDLEKRRITQLGLIKRMLAREAGELVDRLNPLPDPARMRRIRALKRAQEVLEEKGIPLKAALDKQLGLLAEALATAKNAEIWRAIAKDDLRAAERELDAFKAAHARLDEFDTGLRYSGRLLTLGVSYLFEDSMKLPLHIYDQRAGAISQKAVDPRKRIESAERDISFAKSMQEEADKIQTDLRKLIEGFDMTAHSIEILRELQKYAERHNTTIEKMASSLPSCFEAIASGAFGVADLETALVWVDQQKEKAGSKEERAFRQFINHTLIPQLDFFTLHALGNEPQIEWLQPDQFPQLMRHSHYSIDFSRAKPVPEKASTEFDAKKASFDFSFLFDSSAGNHMVRLERALEMVNGEVADVERMAEAFEQRVAENLKRIRELKERQAQAEGKRADVHSSNAMLAKEIEKLGEKARRIQRQYNAVFTPQGESFARRAIGGTGYWLSRILDDIPIIGAIPDVLEEQSTTIAKRRNRATSKLKFRIETSLVDDETAYLASLRIDPSEYSSHLDAIEASMKEIDKDSTAIAIRSNDAKRHAIEEAFLAKYILTFGHKLSSALKDTAESQGLTIDQFLESFGSKSRLGEAVKNLAVGLADSNDISVILADSAAVSETHPEARFRALKIFVEETIKPNIGDVYSHASKVDLIYQANLTGLGTQLHKARKMIRVESDHRIAALVNDGFGVGAHQRIHEATVQGAVDVKRLFDFYMHRHGDRWLSDAKIGDGMYSDARVKKGVSVVDEDTVDRHVDSVKRARSFRQQAPEITDMFLRICAYDYFYPQAPNHAEGTNIMRENPEAPASYVMVNRVINEFIRKLSIASIDEYRTQVGERLDNLIAQTFMDFFEDLGRQHAADPAIGLKRADLKQTATETGTHGLVFDHFTQTITRDALAQFPKFLEIYRHNLEKQLESLPESAAAKLMEQIEAVAKLTSGLLKPEVRVPGQRAALDWAHQENHSFENLAWHGGRNI